MYTHTSLIDRLTYKQKNNYTYPGCVIKKTVRMINSLTDKVWKKIKRL